MLATLFASGATLPDIQSKDALFEDVYQGILSMDPPAFTLRGLDPERARRGRDVFDGTCASCHGVQSGPNASFPNHVEHDAGTDPVRAASFDENDAAAINASWFGARAPMTATGGYLAPSLRGVWASAPYLHNGSRARPHERARLFGAADAMAPHRHRSRRVRQLPRWLALRRGHDGVGLYDRGTQGLRHHASRPLRRRPHTYGDALSTEEREDVVEYLLGL